MIWNGALAVVFAAGLLAAGPARAACKKDADCASGQVCQLGTCVAKSTAAPAPAAPAADTGAPAAGKPIQHLAWGGVGLYSISESVDTPLGTFSSSTTNFGFNGGAAVNLVPLTPDLPLAVFGNVALTFGSDFSAFPITGGAAVHYDKLPVQLLGGLGFTLMPHTGGGNTPLGLGILLMGLYPLPQVAPNVSAQAQVQYHIMNDGFSLLVFDIGAGYTF